MVVSLTLRSYVKTLFPGRVLYNALSPHRTFSSGDTPERTVRIGCASGFWGDTPTAAPQLIHNGKLDFLMFDYLSEITMSLLTAARAKKPEFGYAPDFVLFAIGPYLNDIKRKGIRVLSKCWWN
ncbi:uncharacterized protein LOC135214528 [Macrobrachium nipponense]|uniref:uncharacterized protein LOC135214528 n=1 Tax=Macrobrachium nipponense TaxID=159736 RepID=UPI0030C8C15D